MVSSHTLLILNWIESIAVLKSSKEEHSLSCEGNLNQVMIDQTVIQPTPIPQPDPLPTHNRST